VPPNNRVALFFAQNLIKTTKEMEINNESLTSTQLVSINLSDDRQYLMLTEKKVINLKAVDLLTHEDERIRQAYFMSCIFDRYIDHSRRLQLVEELKEMLVLRIIELKMDDHGDYMINVLRNKGQASLLRLLVRFMTSQKRKILTQSQPFNDLKHLLMQRMRHLGIPIPVNSLSVTLSRAIKSVMTTVNSLS
jgi:hypothetical protein